MKITGLPYAQRTALKHFLLSERKLDGDFEIHFADSISQRRLHSLWYGGSVVNIHYQGYTFQIEAAGDVIADLYTRGGRHLCHVKDKTNNGTLGSEMLSFFRSDKSLENSLSDNPRRYRLEIQNGNWWECFITDPRGVFHDLMWALDQDNLFLAIAEVLECLDEIIQTIEEESVS